MKKLITTLLALSALSFVAISFVAISFSTFSLAAHADDLGRGLDTGLNDLGGNPRLMRRARELQPRDHLEVVENRTVDRNWRLELGVDYGMLAGGDSYVTSQGFGANADLHINPHWSVGARYLSYNNSLTPEGQQMVSNASTTSNNGFAANAEQISYPVDSALGVISFYPIYGKLNLFDEGIAQFDLYVLGGAGQTRSQTSGISSTYTSTTWTAGGGAGIWLSQHFASRLEVRYQSYQDQIFSGTRNESAVVTTLSIGILL